MSQEGKQIETIEMEDGRKVDFAGKRKLLKATQIEGGKVFVRLDFRNGMVRRYGLSDYPKVSDEDPILRFAGHGGEQKFGDATAGIENVDDMVLAVEQVDENLAKGDWASRVEGSGLSGMSVLAKALLEVTRKSAEEVKAWLKSKTPAEKLALRTSAKLRPVIERIEGEKAAKASKVDTESLLAEIA